MNLLEHYITKIDYVKEFNEWNNEEWAKGIEFVKVGLWWRCYRDEDEFSEKIWRVSQWEQIKKQGYFMG